MKNKTRKECREDTGYEPEDISRMANESRALSRHELKNNLNWTHEDRVEWIYKGLQEQRRNMQRKVSISDWKKEQNKGKDKACWKCSGKGVLPHFGHIDLGKCYACNGEGKVAHSKPKCTGTASCLHCESGRRKAYQTGARYYA